MSQDVDLRPEPTPRSADAAVGPSGCRSAEGYAGLLAPPPATLQLRGDPGFDAERLSPEARAWYDRLWDAIVDADRNRAIVDRAASDDLYEYSRAVHTHLLALLTGFRATGDLGLLDEVDRIAEHMRSRLRDPWRGTLDGSNGERDGFVNWVFRAGGSSSLEGKDTHTFDEMRTHALIAEVAWALHHNRDLESPHGVDYGRRADVWTSYLLEHFEPKWRERNDVRDAEFPFLSSASMHASVAFVKYHHYVGRITGSDGHRSEAERLSEVVLGHFVPVEVGGSTALVWPRSVGPSLDYLQPATYARYVIGDAVDLRLDGMAAWSEATVSAMAHTVRSLLLDVGEGTIAFRRDVGGGSPLGGYAASDEGTWSRPTAAQFAVSPTSFVARWDRSGTVAAVACEVSEEVASPSVHIAAGMLLAVTAR